jgi:hypothetical protein
MPALLTTPVVVAGGGAGSLRRANQLRHSSSLTLPQVVVCGFSVIARGEFLLIFGETGTNYINFWFPTSSTATSRLCLSLSSNCRSCSRYVVVLSDFDAHCIDDAAIPNQSVGHESRRRRRVGA